MLLDVSCLESMLKLRKQFKLPEMHTNTLKVSAIPVQVPFFGAVIDQFG